MSECQGLIEQPAHRRAHLRIGPDWFKELFDPLRIDFNVVVDQKQVVVLCMCDCEIALVRAVSLRMMKVADFKSRLTPARIFVSTTRLGVITAMNYNHFRDANSLFRKTVETAPQHLGSANRGDDRRDGCVMRLVSSKNWKHAMCHVGPETRVASRVVEADPIVG